MDFQPAGDDHDEDDLEYLDFGDPVVTQKPRSPPKFPQYVPKFRGGFGLPDKKKQQANGGVNEACDGNVISKRRQRKKRGAAQPAVTDAIAKDNFRIACSRGNEEELKTHLVNGERACVCVCVRVHFECMLYIMAYQPVLRKCNYSLDRI